MLLNKKEQLLFWFDSHNSKGKSKPIIYAYSSKSEAANGRGKTFWHSCEDTGIAAEATKKELESFIHNMCTHNIKYIIRLRESKEKSADQAETEYHHIDENMKAFGISGVQGFGFSPEKLDEIKAQAKNEARAEMQKEIENENRFKALEEKLKDSEDVMNKFQTILSHPTIAGIGIALAQKFNILPKAVPVASAINGVQSESVQNLENTEMASEEENKRLEAVAEKLSQKDPDFLKVLEKLAHIAETDPAKYDQYKPLFLGL